MIRITPWLAGLALAALLGGCTLSTQGSLEGDASATPVMSTYGMYGSAAPTYTPAPSTIAPQMYPQMYPQYGASQVPYPYVPGAAGGLNFGAGYGGGYGYSGYGGYSYSGYGPGYSPGFGYGPGSCPLLMAVVRSCGGYSGRGDLPPPGWHPNWHH